MSRLLGTAVVAAAVLAALEIVVGAPGELFPGGFTLFAAGGAVVIIRVAKALAPLLQRPPESDDE